MVVVKHYDSPRRGSIWRVNVFIDGKRLIRPGFKRRKSAIKLAAMLVQQMLLHGWEAHWQVYDEQNVLERINLAALGSKMERGERRAD
jgi:hypothetical protein